MPLGRRFVERRGARLRVARVDPGAFVQQQRGDPAIAFPTGLVERRGARFVARVDVRAVRHQQRGHVLVAARGRQVQRRPARTVRGIHRGAMRQKQFGDVPVVFDHREIERRGSGFHMMRIHLGPVRDQQRRDVPIAGPGRVVQSGSAQCVARVHIRARGQQCAHLFHISGCDCLVQIGRLGDGAKQNAGETACAAKAQPATPPDMHR